MTPRHDRFDSLAGALALGEATAAERAELVAHATDCAVCRDDLALAPPIVTALADARDSETWRPSVGDGILRRVRDARMYRATLIVRALAWTAALSLVLNVAVASGIVPRLVDALRSGTNAPRAALAVVPAVAAGPHVARTAERRSVEFRVAALAVHHAVRRHLASAPVPVVRGVVPPQVPAADADVPDVLAGLDLAGHGSPAKSVALELHRP